LLMLISILMVVIATGLLYKGHITNSRPMLLVALVLSFSGVALLYYLAGGNL